MESTPITLYETPERTLQYSIDWIKSELEKNINGSEWSLEQFEGSHDRGLGIVLLDYVVDAIGIDEITKRLRSTGLEFSYGRIPVVDSDETMACFNAVFWVAKSKL